LQPILACDHRRREGGAGLDLRGGGRPTQGGHVRPRPARAP
jgi:hypothetical protein